MNTKRRARLDKILNDLTTATDLLADLGAEERDAFENMPEGIQDSEQGRRAEAIADAIDEAVEEISLTLDSVLDACG